MTHKFPQNEGNGEEKNQPYDMSVCQEGSR